MLLGTAINIVVGAIWYSPILFAKEWLEIVELDDNGEDVDIVRLMKVYVFLVTSLIFAGYLVGFLVVNLNISNMKDGLILVMILWIGTSGPSVIKRWGFEKKNIRICFVNNVYEFICYLTMAMIYVRYSY